MASFVKRIKDEDRMCELYKAHCLHFFKYRIQSILEDDEDEQERKFLKKMSLVDTALISERCKIIIFKCFKIPITIHT